MPKPIVFMFSGQGSHYYHMGKEFFETLPTFKKWMHYMDEIVSEELDRSIIDLIYDDQVKKDDVFDRAVYSSPAIMMVEYALAQELIGRGIKPDYLLGASLGEYPAAILSGILDLKESLQSVIKNLRVFEKHCEAGCMIGVLHDVRLFEDSTVLNKNSELAAINFDSHFVITCRKTKLNEIETYLEEKDILYQTLPVTLGFHSSLCDPAIPIIKAATDNISVHKPKIPFISSTYAKTISSLSENHFLDVFRQPIQFQKTIQGFEKENDAAYIDIGPSGTLANFVHYNLSNKSNSETFTIMTPFGQDSQNFMRIQNIFGDNKKKVKRMKTYVFPGQGSQVKGMGGVLFDEFQDLVKKADEILGYSIRSLCEKDEKKQLHLTQFTQPALYVVNALSYYKKLNDSAQKPDFVAGHSLGEYNALLAAGGVDFETGLKLVKKRAELMSQASGGAMAAILGLPIEKVVEIIKKNNLNEIDIANYNSPTQVVISGLKQDIIKSQQFFEKANANYIPLNVSAAFHSRYMKQAKQEFKKFLEGFEFLELKIPLISNVHAQPYKQSDIITNLADQLESPVKWTESIKYLIRQGDMEFEEIGHGNVLTKMIQQIDNESTSSFSRTKLETEKPKAVEKLESDNPSHDEIKVSLELNEDKLETQETAFNSVTKEDSGRSIRLENDETTECFEKPAMKNDEMKVDQLQEPIKFQQISASSLGNEEFKADYNLKYAYVAGGMMKGIASKELVVKMSKAGMMSYFGAGGLRLDELEKAILYIQNELEDDMSYGVNLPNSAQENEIVDLLLEYKINSVEASAYIQITPALVKYRLKGLKKKSDGSISTTNKIMAKTSRPEVATVFLSPAPSKIVETLLHEKVITEAEADLSRNIPMADDICVEADSGGRTDSGVAYALMPAIIKLRDEMMEKNKYTKKVRIGAAGGIGAPEAAAAAFILGADFILTGSINQCTVEAETSDIAKDLLQDMNVQDTQYAPAADMFEMGAKAQVLQKGVFFPARANKLYDLYTHYDSLNELDDKTKKQLEERYFRCSLNKAYEYAKTFYPKEDIERAEQHPKQKMALVFKWYIDNAVNLALEGIEDQRVDFQIQCGPALGTFNQWIKGTEFEKWQNRHVDKIAEKIMQETAIILNHRIKTLVQPSLHLSK